MLKVTLTPTFWAPVRIKYVEGNGKDVTGQFRAQFKRHDKNEVAELLEGEKTTGEEDYLLKRVLVGFAEIEVEDDDGTLITAGDTEKMFDWMWRKGFGTPLLQSYFGAYPKAAAKN